MGLAASQARLLTITSRKSDAQYESMRLSHQKLALSRNLQDVSNEYQRSLNQTKLYFDYYGVGATDTQLTYSVLMHPSTMNNYVPIMLTNSQNQVVLNSSLAAAARRAGIPQEGLGCCTSEIIRTVFVEALAEEGVINNVQLDQIRRVPYNQYMGVGDNNLVTQIAGEPLTYETFLDRLSTFKLNESMINAGVSVVTGDGLDGASSAAGNINYIGGDDWVRNLDAGSSNWASYTIGNSSAVIKNGAYRALESISLKDLVTSRVNNIVQSPTNPLETMGNIVLVAEGGKGRQINDTYANLKSTCQNVIGSLEEAIMSICGGNMEVMSALDAANTLVIDNILNTTERAPLPIRANGSDNLLRGAWGNDHAIENQDVVNWIDYSGTNYTYNQNNPANNGEGDAIYRNYFLDGPGSSELERGGRHYTVTNGTEEKIYASFAALQENDSTSEAALATNAIALADEALALVRIYGDTDEDSDDDFAYNNVGAISLTNFIQTWFSAFIEEYANQTGNSITGLNTLNEAHARSDIFNGYIVEDNPEVSLISKFLPDSTQAAELNSLMFEQESVEVNSNAARYASFYDALLNQICLQGWVENNQVSEDASYLQEMLKSGRMFIYQMEDDDYYYQNNYSTNQLIKELDDEAAIAQAEARYTTEKARINAKEEELDMKMKNLDTEISALEQEYEAVKKMISNNAQKAFSRYQS